jgi:hypothetical protein
LDKIQEFISKQELIKKKTRGGKVSAIKRKKLRRRMNNYMARKTEEKRKRDMMEPLPMPVCVYYLKGSCNKVRRTSFCCVRLVKNFYPSALMARELPVMHVTDLYM